MEHSRTSSEPRSTTASAVTLMLFLIFLALLLTANEIRFQGCVSRQDAQTAINAERPSTVSVLKCSRLPFGA